MVAVSGDLEIPAGVVARERVPERMRLAEHGELLALVVGKDDVDEEREARGQDAEGQRERRDSERRWDPPAQQRSKGF